LVIGGLNTVFSVFYYLKVLKVMVLDKPLEEVEARPAVPIRLSPAAVVYGALLGLMILIGGVAWSPLSAAREQGKRDFVPVTPGSPAANAGGAPPAPAGAAGPGGGQQKGAQPKGGGQPKGGQAKGK